MTRARAAICHAEHVGSLLRPPELLEARRARRGDGVTAEKLSELEDRAVLDALELQRQAGIQVFTDGEMRRETWMASAYETLEGVAPHQGRVPTWHRDGDADPSTDETYVEHHAAHAKLRQKLNLTHLEADFLARHAPGQYKVTMMSASMGAVLWQPGVSEEAYPTPMDLIQDLVALQAREIEGLVRQGTTWIQLDSLVYNQVIDDRFRQETGVPVPPQAILEGGIRVDNQLIAAARRANPDVTVGMHFCRGNNRSAWMSKGSYEPVAERLFGDVDVDRFLLEYDTDRAGGFEPLRFVPRGKTVVLGLVSSKVPELESPDVLRRRIDEAARHVPLENLALAPQCGFASTAAGNLLTVDDERRKLELVVDTARKVWG
jgi:5-methyltetrahydropteroyltriglutamate--homocysteine methyltransferase